MIVSVSKKTSALRRALVDGSGAASVTAVASPTAVGVAWAAGGPSAGACCSSWDRCHKTEARVFAASRRCANAESATPEIIAQARLDQVHSERVKIYGFMDLR